MLIGMRNAMLAGGDLSAKSYVQDGLVAMWDGIENAGWGTHDSSATIWKDLAGNRDATLVNGGGFDSNSLTNSNASNTPAWFSSPISAADSRTVEVVILPVTPQPQTLNLFVVAGGTMMENADKVVTSREGLYGCGVLTAGGSVWFGNSDIYKSPVNQAFSASYDYSSKTAYENGIVVAGEQRQDGYTTYSYGNRMRVPSIGGFAPNSLANWVFVGHIYCIRYYSRALTAAEVAANYAVDKARFNLA